MVQKEVDKSLVKTSQLQQKIEEMDSFTFDLDEELRVADCKRRSAHKYAKHFKKLSNRWLKRSKELLKQLNEIGELN